MDIIKTNINILSVGLNSPEKITNNDIGYSNIHCKIKDQIYQPYTLKE